MLNIESVNYIGIRIGDKSRSIACYESLGFGLKAAAAGFADHP